MRTSSDLSADTLHTGGPARVASPSPHLGRHLVVCGHGCWRRVTDPANPKPKNCPRHRKAFHAPGPGQPAPCDACLSGMPDKHTGVACHRCDCGCRDHLHGVGGQGADLSRPKRSKVGRAKR